MQQTCKNNFFLHAVFHGEVGALQDVFGSVHETQPEKIVEGGFVRHWLQHFYVFAGARHIEESGAFAVFPLFDLRLDFGDRGIFLGLVPVPRRVACFRPVQFGHHVGFEGIGFRLGVHAADGFGPAETVKKFLLINLHGTSSA